MLESCPYLALFKARGRTPAIVYCAVLSAAISGFLFGYDSAAINAALSAVGRRFAIGPVLQGFLASAVLVGAVPGSLASGFPAERLGRKATLLVSCALFCAGAVVSASAPSAAALICGRLILGIALNYRPQLNAYQRAKSENTNSKS